MNSQCLGRRYFLWMGENCSLAGPLMHAPFTRFAIVKFRTAVFCIPEKVSLGKITNIIILSFHDGTSSWVKQTMLFAVSKKSILFFSTYYGHLLLNKWRKKESDILGIELANESSFDSNALTRFATGSSWICGRLIHRHRIWIVVLRHDD